jgi:hypothetical protein
VREGPGAIEQRARFLVEKYGDSHQPPLQYEAVLRGLERDEELLQASGEYERVVIWCEFDCYDQLMLIRVLGHYATHRCPARLEMINIGDFPGAVRFVGLGQLPPEALRMLWSTRQSVTPSVLTLGLDAWRALANTDPRRLAAIARGGTPMLPLLTNALHITRICFVSFSKSSEKNPLPVGCTHSTTNAVIHSFRQRHLERMRPHRCSRSLGELRWLSARKSNLLRHLVDVEIV